MTTDTSFSFDDSLQRAEMLVSQLEQSEAISMDDYKRIAGEVTALLKQCKEQLLHP